MSESSSQGSVFNFHQPLSADEAVAIASAMHDVAKADGVHPAEVELIEEFVAEVASDLGEEFVLIPMNPEKLAQCLGDPDVRRLAMQSLVLLAMADGKVSSAEAALNQKYAQALGLAAEYPVIESSISGWVQSGDVGSLFA